MQHILSHLDNQLVEIDKHSRLRLTKISGELTISVDPSEALPFSLSLSLSLFRIEFDFKQTKTKNNENKIFFYYNNVILYIFL